MRWLLAAVYVIPLAAQYDPKQPLPEHVLFLVKARAAARQEFSQMPSYVCDEAIERWFKRARDRQFRLEDSVRLQVAVTADGEIHAPAGATQFNDTPLNRIAPGGLIGSGEFSTHVRNILISGGATFEPSGEEEINGRRAHKYNYRVPQNLSGYQLRLSGQAYRIAHEGSVWFDASTLDLRQLEIRGLDLPLAMAIETIATRISFERVPAGDGKRLLPVGAETAVKHFSGDLRRNVIRYSGCRQFGSETKLILDEPR